MLEQSFADFYFSFRYAVHWIQQLLEADPLILDHDDLSFDPLNFIDEEEEKREWETRYQSELSAAKEEMDQLDLMPCLTYSSEDASRTWHGHDGQPMPLWTPPTPSMTGETDLDHHLSFLYKTRLMEESELPPIYVKKETTPPPLSGSAHATAGVSSGLKRTASEAGFGTGLDPGSHLSIDHKIPKYRKDIDGQTPLGPSTAGGGFAPRSLFERPQAAIPKSSKIRNRIPNRQMPPGVGSSPVVPGPIPPPSTSPVIPGAMNPVAGLRHPLPRPQVEAENVPEWLVQEDWALLYAVRELQELPVNLVVNSPAHTPNWDLVSDIVNSVSRCYRGPRQCRNRYDTIILPREEGRIYDMPPSAVAAMAAQAAAAQAAVNKKNKKKQSSGLKLPANNRPMKTSALFAQDNNTAWSSMYANRFENIKAVANKRSPTTKPLVVNPSMKNSQHAAVLSDSGITYDSPLNPIQVAANRADRIQREKQRTQQDQQQLLAAQQRTAAAQAAAQAAASAAQQQQTRIVTAAIASPQQTIVQQQPQQVQQQVQQQQQQTQTVVTSSPHPQAVVVGISQPMTTVNNAQLNNVIQSRIQQQQQQQPQQQLQQLRPTQQQTIGIQELVRVCTQQPTHSTVVVTSQPTTAVVSVASLTPSQLQAAQKLVGTGTIKGGLVTAQGRALTQQQVNHLRQHQQAIMKKNAQDNNAAVAAAQKARLQGMQIAGTSSASTAGVNSGSITTGAIMTPQKVTVTAVSLTPSNLVTVVTQSGHPKTHFIRQVSTGPGGKATTNIRPMTEADVKLLLATKQQQQLQNAKGQQVTQLQVPAQSNLAAQLLAGGIHVQQHTGAGGAQVATLVKTVSAGGSGGVAVVGTGGQVQPSVTIPVANVSLPQVKAALARSGVTNPGQMQLALRQQIIQQQQRKPGTTIAGTQQKVTLGQVGAKGVPAQLIVSSSGTVTAGGQKQHPHGVTVQQFQQIVKTVQPGGVSGTGTMPQQIVTHSQQQIIPHQVFSKQAVVSTFAAGTVTGIITTVGGNSATSTSTVQARVIPVSSTSAAGRMQQIQVVAASPTQVQVATTSSTNARHISAPNVTVDASGRPTGTFVTAAGTQHIRVAGNQQQFLTSSGQNVAVAVRGPVGVLATHHSQQQQQQQQQQTSQGVAKLQVVGPSNTATPSGQSTERS